MEAVSVDFGIRFQVVRAHIRCFAVDSFGVGWSDLDYHHVPVIEFALLSDKDFQLLRDFLIFGTTEDKYDAVLLFEIGKTIHCEHLF